MIPPFVRRNPSSTAQDVNDLIEFVNILVEHVNKLETEPKAVPVVAKKPMGRPRKVKK